MYGDNGALLPTIADASVDLIYMDPPFGSDRVYTGKHGRGFTDVWAWTNEEREAYRKMFAGEAPTLGGVTYALPNKVREAVIAAVDFSSLAQDEKFTAYILHMGVRLAEYLRVLKPTGNLVIHCDQTASHILKTMVDAAFGRKQFRNEIIWDSTDTKKTLSTRRLPRSHDTLLVWGRSNESFFDHAATFIPAPLPKEYKHDDGDGRGIYSTVPLTAGGTTGGESCQLWRGIDPTQQGQGRNWSVSRKARAELGLEGLGTLAALDALDAAGYIYWPPRGGMPRLKQYARWHDGAMIEDIWDDIKALSSTVAERLGYPTQKPVALLERIIKLYCPEDGVVLDPFGGCGTAADAAERLGRSWIIMDQSIHAIDVMDRRMMDTHGIGEGHGLTIEGEWPGKDLAKINALPAPERRRYLARLAGAASLDTDRKGDTTRLDRGVHGEFGILNGSKKPRKGIMMIAAGEGGGGNLADVETLARLRREEEAEVAVMICDNEPTPRMQAEAAKAGSYTDPGGHVRPRIILTTTPEVVARGVATKLPDNGELLVLPYVPAKKAAASYATPTLV